MERYVRITPTLSADELFEKFREIVDLYILAGSDLEVNIETAMRNKVLKVSHGVVQRSRGGVTIGKLVGVFFHPRNVH